MTKPDHGIIWLGAEDGGNEVSPEEAGSKAAGIWRMARLGLRTPPAFALPASLCAAVNDDPKNAAALVTSGLRAGIGRLEAATGRHFGAASAPLLLSVRSGAAVSMPGMMSTVLNIGLNRKTTRGLIQLTGDPRFAWDSYRRFLESYATVVQELPPATFARRLAEMIDSEHASDESELDCEALETLSLSYSEAASGLFGKPVPEEPLDQLTEATLAVYRSWEGRKAREYRRINRLEGLAGTAVTVQAMVFGNAARRSGSGVAFSRDPATGEKRLYVDFLPSAQGEDVVSGRRTPSDAATLEARLPDIYTELEQGAARLEADRRDVQDIEFTVQEGTLYFLQTRSAKRTPLAALRTTVNLVREGVIDAQTGLARLADVDLARVGTSKFVTPGTPVSAATPASPGVASGRIAFDSPHACRLAASGDPVILVREEPATEDIDGFNAASGILTARGGRTSHAAVVARQLGKVCLVGCANLKIAEDGRSATLGETRVLPGEWLSLDGSTGEVSLGQREIEIEASSPEHQEVERWRNVASKSVNAV